MTPDEIKAAARQELIRREAKAELERRASDRNTSGAGWTPKADADNYERFRPPSTISDTVDGGMGGIPFADEIVSGMMTPVRAVKDAWRGEGLAIGRSYNRNYQVQQELAERRNERSPVASAVGSIATGTVLGGQLAKGGVTLLKGAQPMKQTVMRSAGEGAAYGVAYGAGEGGKEGGFANRAQSAWDGLWGGLAVGGATPLTLASASALVKRLVSPFQISPERQAAVDVLRREGVELSAGQKTGSKTLRYAESEIGGQKAEGLFEKQGEQFTAAALRRAGINAPRATPDVIDDAFNRIGADFDGLAARNTVVPDRQLMGDLRDTYDTYSNLVPESARAPIVQNTIGDVVGQMQKGGLSGDGYQAYRSRLDRAARSARADPQLSDALFGLRNSLDDAMERSIAASNPNDLGTWREARRQYRNMIVLEKASTGAGENAAMGLISPSQLRNATVNQNRRAYARGQGDFAELSRAGESVMKAMPQSGTAPRTAARNLFAAAPTILGAGAGASAGGGYGAFAGAMAGAALPSVAGKVMMSSIMQKVLANQKAATIKLTPEQLKVRDMIMARLSGQTGTETGPTVQRSLSLR